MNKFAIAVLFTLMVTSFAITIQEAAGMIAQDACAVDTLNLIGPQIEAKVIELQNQDSALQIRTGISKLVKKAKQTYDKCQGNLRTSGALGQVKGSKVAYFLASNCIKDAGALLYVGEGVIVDPFNITNDVIGAFFFYVIGQQGVDDCSKLWNHIK